MKILTLLALLAVTSLSFEASAKYSGPRVHKSQSSLTHSTHKSSRKLIKSTRSASIGKRSSRNRLRDELLAPLGMLASSRKITKREEDCLVRTMNSEARDTDRGLQSVANVVFNRYRQSHRHICTITRAPAQFTEKPVRGSGRALRLRHIAKSVTTNELSDITRGATNFFTSSAKHLIRRYKHDGYVVTTEIDGNTFMKKI